MKERQRKRPTYGPELRAKAVAMVRSSGQKQDDIAQAMGCSTRQLRRWMKQSDIDAGKRPGLTTKEHQEMARLRRANVLLQERIRLMEEARDFFARETR